MTAKSTPMPPPIDGETFDHMITPAGPDHRVDAGRCLNDLQVIVNRSARNLTPKYRHGLTVAYACLHAIVNDPDNALRLLRHMAGDPAIVDGANNVEFAATIINDMTGGCYRHEWETITPDTAKCEGHGVVFPRGETCPYINGAYHQGGTP